MPRIRHNRRPRLFATLILVCAVTPVFAQESTQGEAPAPTSVRGLSGPFAKALEDRIEAETLFFRLDRKLEAYPPFVRDTRANVHLRTYYFDRDFSTGEKSEAWAIGGWADYASGWYRDWLSVGATYYLTEKLVGDEENDGTLLLAPGQEGFGILGQAYVALRHRAHKAVFYRQEIDVPYVNKQDIRMVPNTFEAYRLEGGFANVPLVEKLEYGVGYVDKIRRLNSEKFVSMSASAGVEGVDRGLVMAGLAVRPDENLLVGGVNHFVDDTLNIFYTEADYTHMLFEGVGVRYQGQFTHQQSVGDNLLTGSDFDTWVVGGRVAASYKGAILKAAFSSTADGEHIRNPYGSYPGYISLMQSNFNLADMDAWLLGASFNFQELGLRALSMFANYAEGYNALDASDGTALPDQREFNITGDYRIEEGWLRGLWFRVRWSTLDVAGQDRTTDDFRVIVNYEIPAL